MFACINLRTDLQLWCGAFFSMLFVIVADGCLACFLHQRLDFAGVIEKASLNATAQNGASALCKAFPQFPLF